MADNAGDVAGAAVFSFVLVHWLNPFQVLLVVHLPLLAALLGLKSAFSRRSAAAVTLAVAALVAGALFEDRLLPAREGRRIRLHGEPLRPHRGDRIGWRGHHFQ
jgi:hypothetical protein